METKRRAKRKLVLQRRRSKREVFRTWSSGLRSTLSSSSLSLPSDSFLRVCCSVLTIPLPVRPCAVLAVWWVGGGGCGRQAASTRRPSALQLLSHPQRVLERPGGEGLCQVSFHYRAYVSGWQCLRSPFFSVRLCACSYGDWIQTLFLTSPHAG